MSRIRRFPAVAAALALAVAFGGCGGAAETGEAAGARGATEGAGQGGQAQRVATAAAGLQTSENPADTAAAELRAKLTALFHEHVSLAAFTTRTAARTGFDSAQTEAAIRALERNSATLARQIATVHPVPDEDHGFEEAERFRSEWDTHTTYLVDYIEGASGGGQALKIEAREALYDVDSELAVVITDLTQGALTENAAYGLLNEQVGALTMMIDAIAMREATAAGDILDAAKATSDFAESLARAFAIHVPSKVSGDATTKAATVRARLTGLLVEHVALTGALAHAAEATGAGSAQTTATAEELRAVTEELADEIERLYGSNAAEEFTQIYEEHIMALVEYAKASASGEDMSRPSSGDFARRLTGFLADVTGGELRRDAFTKTLSEQVTATERAIEAIADGSASAAEELEQAESLSVRTAELLATAIAAQRYAKSAR